MYRQFTADQLQINQSDNSVTLTFTYDIDEDTVNDKSIYLTEKQAHNIIHTVKKTNGTAITLCLDYLKVNTPYVLVATREIKNILGESLDIELRKEFVVDSVVDSSVKILNPANHEEVKNVIHVLLEEKPGKHKKLFNRFLVEIAGDVNFFTTYISSEVVDSTIVDFKEIKPSREYYVRARSQDAEGNHGNWSEPVTFTAHLIDDTSTNDDDELIFVRGLELVSHPENGITPSGSFLFQFDRELDPDSIDDSKILVIKRRF